MTSEAQPHQPSLLGRILAFIVGAGVLVLAFMFSLVALAVIAVGGLLLWAWLWWKTRAIRQQMREQSPLNADFNRNNSSNGQIIEGEVIRDSAMPTRPERLLRQDSNE